ncbi:MAG: flagellar hook-associated protein FlgK [Peptococcaceae bacterium]|jgi:flagellar hook-associated protein 1 FlgK|nr:flagellar hook-associated protein FlgK [Peptococcaceae bacterium]MDH7524782.1 flagellar hook-associated protein FlgK [Peptococcaceae bacterium]
MRSTFYGLNIGLKALQAQQKALDVTSHNIANANTPGYTRQDVIMEASPAFLTEKGYVGAGVDITEIRRLRDEFLDVQIRTESKYLGEWEVRSDILAKLEGIINEPSDSGLRSVMDEYWAAWQQLSTNAASAADRNVVIQSGVDLADLFNQLDSTLSELQADINKGIESRVSEINSIAKQVSALNDQIIKAELGGFKANDLRDRRGLLVEQLSKIISVQVVEDRFGALDITAGGGTLVANNYYAVMKFTDDPADPTRATLQWVDPAGGNVVGDVRVNGGSLQGYIEMRDKTIVRIKNDLSQLAARIAEEVNALHSAGSGLNNTTGTEPGLDFFVKKDENIPFSASNIMVNPQLIDDPNKVAASQSSPVVSGDGSNALAIAQLKSKLTMNPAGPGEYTTTFDDFYRSTVAALGIEAGEAERMLDNQNLLINQLSNKREAISGVFLDEEMVNMIKYQHAYEAAARIINAMDEMLDTIVNRLGLVGR